MVEKGGRQRERERHTGEPSTQARSTWPFNIAPTRFLSLADNCTILLHSLVLSSLPPRPTACTFSSPRFPHRSAISLSHLPSSSNSLILSLRHLSHFHVASCCRHASCTTLPLVYPVASFVCATLSLHLFLARYSTHTCVRNPRTFSLSHIRIRKLPCPSSFSLLLAAFTIDSRIFPVPLLFSDPAFPLLAFYASSHTRRGKALYSLHRGLGFGPPFIPTFARCPRSSHYART